MKAVVVYESLWGNTAEVARAIAEGLGRGPSRPPPDLSHPKLRAWLAGLPEGHGHAAFDTRVDAWYGRGAAPRILRRLERAGYRPVAKARGFFVSGHPIKPTTGGTLRSGETERARRWGAELAKELE